MGPRATAPNPGYFDRSPFEGEPLTAPGAVRSRRLQRYEEMAAGHFARVPAGLSQSDLEWLDRYLATRLELEREERRMHFGALALVCVLFFLLLPGLVRDGFSDLALDALAALLLALLVPYVFVYFGYENRVRAMGLGRLRLIEAAAQKEDRGDPDPELS